jgi:hypothetical protein
VVLARPVFFSTFLRYSSMIERTTMWSSPRARAGFSMFEAFIEPSRPGAHHRVRLVEEEDLGVGVLARPVYDLLEAVLELAAVLGTGHEAREVDGEYLRTGVTK